VIVPPTAGEAVASFSDDPGRPDVWVFDRTLDSFRALCALGPVSPAERERAALLLKSDAGPDFLSRRAAVRRVLAHYLGRAPEDVRLVTLPGGKPTFVPHAADLRRLAFSSGVSGDLFCLAVGATSSLGVDVERARVVPRAAGIASRWFSEEEAQPILTAEGAADEGSAPDARSLAFLRAWTGKEALAKRHAAGLRLLRRGRRELDLAPEERAGTLVRFEPADGYVGALAAPVPVAGLRLLVDVRLA